MKVKVELFREIVNLEKFTLTVEAETELQAVGVAIREAEGSDSEDDRRSEGSYTDATEWRLGKSEVLGTEPA